MLRPNDFGGLAHRTVLNPSPNLPIFAWSSDLIDRPRAVMFAKSSSLKLAELKIISERPCHSFKFVANTVSPG
jgi:hypothetical protein